MIHTIIIVMMKQDITQDTEKMFHQMEQVEPILLLFQIMKVQQIQFKHQLIQDFILEEENQLEIQAQFLLREMEQVHLLQQNNLLQMEQLMQDQLIRKQNNQLELGLK